MSAAGVVRRHGVTVAVMALGGAVVVVGSLLPWLRAGRRRRHSYDVFDLVERLGFAPDGAAATALRGWPLVPLLTVVGVVVAWWGWRRAGALVGLVAGLYAGGIGLVVAGADVEGPVHVQSGATVTAVGGAILLAGSIATALVSHGGRTPPTGPVPAAPPAGPPAGPS